MATARAAEVPLAEALSATPSATAAKEKAAAQPKTPLHFASSDPRTHGPDDVTRFYEVSNPRSTLMTAAFPREFKKNVRCCGYTIEVEKISLDLRSDDNMNRIYFSTGHQAESRRRAHPPASTHGH